MALQSGIRLHQYLDDWLIRMSSGQESKEQTQWLLKLVKDLGLIVNLTKSDLHPSQKFDFLGYQFLLDLALVQPMQDRWTNHKISYQCNDSYVHHWIAWINWEYCEIGQDAYETFLVASQDSLEITYASGHTTCLES